MSNLGLPDNRPALAWLLGYLTGSGAARVSYLRWDARRLGGPRAGLSQSQISAAARTLGVHRTSIDGKAWWTLTDTAGGAR